MPNRILQSHIISILPAVRDWFYFTGMWWMVEASRWMRANGYLCVYRGSMERTASCERTDYLSNLAKVIANLMWKTCLRKLRNLFKGQEPFDRQDLGLAPLHRLSIHCLHRTPSSSLDFSRDFCGYSRKRENKASFRCYICNADTRSVALVAVS